MKINLRKWNERTDYYTIYHFNCGCQFTVYEYCDWMEYIQEEDKKPMLYQAYMWDDIYNTDKYNLVEEKDDIVFEEYKDEDIQAECPECEARKVYELPYRTRYVSHGLNAYKKDWYANALLRGLDIIKNPQWEICCSSIQNNIGPFGLWGKGDETLCFKHNVWSYVGEDGRRHIGDKYLDIEGYLEMPIDFKPEDIEQVYIADLLLFDRNQDGKDGKYHSEHWVSNFKPTHLWVKKYFWDKQSEEERSNIKKFASDYLKVKLIMVKEQGRLGYEKIS